MGRTSWLGLEFRERRWEVLRGLLLSREGFFRAGAGTLDEATPRHPGKALAHAERPALQWLA